MSPNETSSTRRTVLKTIGVGTVASSGLVGVATATDDDIMTKSGGGSYNTLSLDKKQLLMGEDEFREYVQKMTDRYGDAGVFGTGDPTYDGFVTADTKNMSKQYDDEDAFDGSCSVDSAAVTYRVETKSDETRYRHLLWAAADNRNLTYVADPFHLVTEPLRTHYLKVGMETGSARIENPGLTGTTAADSSSRVDVELDNGNATFKLPTGRITDSPPFRESTELGSHGRYTLGWEGLADGVRSVATTVETVHTGEDHEITWTTGHGFGYRSLF
ncbi:hypothetical protein E6P09_16655 (plasmid) [Haloferax mediterranei ATCC 33500]|uniref:Uncharacterized protein n=1 Tax=Haloferax mediterranei (strain ATCC 33500 / DSM 1411 / JCM 8866 / NBRC 14739 / NCIMB 2177 / R-4) TaxID=523841 RepID=I3RAW3_HALMT|nr:hypothetical protein [Haloferax mediterranei]AFK21373.1 hypothetical protein HFX_6250 [Haloferax mediterranei ATCC 33500]AHZ24551.1 hypothetical protein BM92_16735 [Haloferax mediterranei ATCC 33500]ELZ97304.1 hypothetical protein C439_18318 [Haloferax mediterranei ATCC 33500]MDX5990396.1 hypothetical protein [Haloferax mediterranei ATCC 33500]QCQ76944.1 hypothetical protein E6P09_16655 [Haloferax mediterranei ATCC 33500]